MTIPSYRVIGRFNRLAALVCLGAALVGLGLLHLPAAGAAGISVTRGDDAVGTGDGCTVREAIVNANQDNQSGSTDCGPGSGADTLIFAGDYTITLASALPNLTSNLTIDGAGRSVTVSGNNAVRVFTIMSSAVVTLSHLSIIRGNSDIGGGIHNNGTLTVSNSTFSGNSASPSFGGGIYNNDTLYLGNNILANSLTGGDCVNTGTLVTNLNNLVEDGSCSPAYAGDPKLGPLYPNGGSTLTQGLLPGSPAIDAGDNAICAAAPVNNRDQRGVIRPIDGNDDGLATCDLGAFEVTYLTYLPLVVKP